MPNFRKDSDAFAVHKQRAISISPLSLDFTPNKTGEFKKFESKITSRLREVAEDLSSTHK